MPIHDWTRVDAGIFHHFHHEWISTISRALNAGVLPPGYYALAEQIAGGLGPDVLTLQSVRASMGPAAGPGDLRRAPESTGAMGSSPAVAPSGGIALASAPPKVRFTATAETRAYARKRSRIAIRHTSGDRVVAMIEIVSPGNKAHRYSFQSFVAKAVELLEAGIHLLVVDLFPPGPRDPQGIHSAIWSEIEGDEFQLPPDQPLTLVAYSAGELKRAFIEPVAPGGTLPEMPLFLEPDRYVPVPLEETYQAAFDAVPRRWQEEFGPSPRS